MPDAPLRRLRQFIAISWLLIAGGCATPPPAPLPRQPQPPPNPQTQAMAQYGEAVISAIGADQMAQQILVTNQITQTLAVGLVIDPNGYVEKGFVRKTTRMRQRNRRCSIISST
jgi:hypothetical protein